MLVMAPDEAAIRRWQGAVARSTIRYHRMRGEVAIVTQMAQRYVVKPLGEGQVLQAYPLVQTAVPHLTLDQWLGYAKLVCEDERHTGPGTGVMSAQNGEGYI